MTKYEHNGYRISTGWINRGEWFAVAHPPASLDVQGHVTERAAICAVRKLIDTKVVDSEGSPPDVHEYGRYTIRTGQNVHGRWFALAHVTGTSIMRKDDPGTIDRGTEQDALDAVCKLIDAME